MWQQSLDYLDLLYRISGELPKVERYNLAEQLRRAGTSISLNIAEGSTGQSDAEQNRFLGLALRSLYETVACLRIIVRRRYGIDHATLSTADEKGEFLAKQVQSMRRSIKRGR